MKGPVKDSNMVAFLDCKLVAQNNFLIESYRGDATRGLESETLAYDHVQILEIEARVNRDRFIELLSLGC